MSNVKNETVKITLEDLAAMMTKMEESQGEILMGQEKTALNMQNFDQRITKMEGTQQKVETEAKVEAAIDAVKPGMIGGFRQASTTKKVVLATVGTAAVAGIAYGTYKGVEYYKDRKAMDLPLLAVEAVPSVSPAKSDAIRQVLGAK